jgi:hypothetical protein
LKFLDLPTLMLDFTLVDGDLMLRSPLCNFAVLQRVAYHQTCACAQSAANRSSGARMAHSHTDDRTSSCA